MKYGWLVHRKIVQEEEVHSAVGMVYKVEVKEKSTKGVIAIMAHAKSEVPTTFCYLMFPFFFLFLVACGRVAYSSNRIIMLK